MSVAQQPLRIRVAEMRCLRGACGLARWDGESSMNVYENLGMDETAKGIDCGMVE